MESLNAATQGLCLAMVIAPIIGIGLAVMYKLGGFLLEYGLVRLIESFITEKDYLND